MGELKLYTYVGSGRVNLRSSPLLKGEPSVRIEFEEHGFAFDALEIPPVFCFEGIEKGVNVFTRPQPTMIREVEPNGIRPQAYSMKPAEIRMINPSTGSFVVIAEPIEAFPAGSMILCKTP